MRSLSLNTRDTWRKPGQDVHVHYLYVLCYFPVTRVTDDGLLLVETGFHYNPRGRCITKLVRFITKLPPVLQKRPDPVTKRARNSSCKRPSLFFIAGRTKKHPKSAKTYQKLKPTIKLKNVIQFGNKKSTQYTTDCFLLYT